MIPNSPNFNGPPVGPFKTVDPEIVKAFHQKDDLDSSRSAHHHSLGLGPHQAAPGSSVKELSDVVDLALTALEEMQDHINRLDAIIDELEPPVGHLLITPYELSNPLYYWCDGSAKSRTDDAALFALYGTKYGPGDGSTTFNLPDYRNKFLYGSFATAAVGSSIGRASFKLTTSDLPAIEFNIPIRRGDNLTPKPNNTSASAWTNNNQQLATAGGSGGTVDSLTLGPVGTSDSINIIPPATYVNVYAYRGLN